MRFVKMAALAFLILLTASVTSALTVKLPETTGKVGSSIEVAIEVENAKDLGSMDVVVAFDSSILKVKSVGKGELNRGLISSSTKDGIIAVSLADSKGINGNGAVAVITFEVLKAGTSDLTIQSVKAYDVNTHVDIQAETLNGKFVAVEGSGAKSTPGFGLLSLIAAAYIAFVLRRR